VNYLLDTNVLSELRKGDRANAGVLSWFAQVDDDSLFTSVLVLGELRRGIESLRRRDPRAAISLDQWLARLTEQFSDRLLPIDEETALQWGHLNVPDPVPTVDGLLAATAMVHGLTLVTRNTGDVARTGVPLIDPFAG